MAPIPIGRGNSMPLRPPLSRKPCGSTAGRPACIRGPPTAPLDTGTSPAVPTPCHPTRCDGTMVDAFAADVVAALDTAALVTASERACVVLPAPWIPMDVGVGTCIGTWVCMRICGCVASPGAATFDTTPNRAPTMLCGGPAMPVLTPGTMRAPRSEPELASCGISAAKPAGGSNDDAVAAADVGARAAVAV